MVEAKLYGRDRTLLPRYHSLATTRRVAEFLGRVCFDTLKTTRLYAVAMAATRSPQRLKYSAPQVTKEGGLMYVEADPSGADSWKLEPVVELLKEGTAGIIPTDTVYVIVCDLKIHSAIECLCRIKNIEPQRQGIFFSSASKYFMLLSARHGYIYIWVSSWQ